MTQKRFSLTLKPEIVTAVDEWRRKQTPIPSFNRALNIIMMQGLNELKMLERPKEA